jgi:hypothetical protein
VFGTLGAQALAAPTSQKPRTCFVETLEGTHPPAAAAGEQQDPAAAAAAAAAADNGSAGAALSGGNGAAALSSASSGGRRKPGTVRQRSFYIVSSAGDEGDEDELERAASTARCSFEDSAPGSRRGSQDLRVKPPVNAAPGNSGDAAAAAAAAPPQQPPDGAAAERAASSSLFAYVPPADADAPATATPQRRGRGSGSTSGSGGSGEQHEACDGDGDEVLRDAHEAEVSEIRRQLQREQEAAAAAARARGREGGDSDGAAEEEEVVECVLDDVPMEVRPGLYIGSMLAERDRSRLRGNQITDILQVRASRRGAAGVGRGQSGSVGRSRGRLGGLSLLRMPSLSSSLFRHPPPHHHHHHNQPINQPLPSSPHTQVAEGLYPNHPLHFNYMNIQVRQAPSAGWRLTVLLWWGSSTHHSSGVCRGFPSHPLHLNSANPLQLSTSTIHHNHQPHQRTYTQVQDLPEEDLVCHFPRCFAFIDQALARDGASCGPNAVWLLVRWRIGARCAVEARTAVGRFVQPACLTN